MILANSKFVIIYSSSFTVLYMVLTAGVKIAVGHWVFPTELIKSLISCVDKFSKISDSKRKIKKKS